jgi:hypothetical protein
VSTAAKPALAPAPLHVLLVGNKAEDFYLIREMLGRANCMLATELDHAHSLEEVKAMLQQKSHWPGFVRTRNQRCRGGPLCG